MNNDMNSLASTLAVETACIDALALREDKPFFVECTTPETDEWAFDEGFDDAQVAGRRADELAGLLDDVFGEGECSVRVNERGSFTLHIIRADRREPVMGDWTDLQSAIDEARDIVARSSDGIEVAIKDVDNIEVALIDATGRSV